MRNARLALLAAVTFAPPALAQDWPQWLGAHRDAVASGFAAPQTWPKQLTQKWKVDVGNGDATPSLVGDKLYVFTREGLDEVIRCLDAADGKQVWIDKYDAQPATPPAAGPHAGPRSSPAVAEGKVVTLGARGTLSCLDAATGKKLWRKDDVHGWPRFYTSSSPIIVDGLCIAQVGGQSNGSVAAYDLNTGAQKWKWTGGGAPGYASPTILDVDGTKLVIALTESKVVAVNLADGKLAWEESFAPQRMGYNASTPIVADHTLIYGGSGRGERAVKLKKQGDHFVARELWKNTENSVQFNTPVLDNGILYGLTQDNRFFALDSQTGKTDWTAPLAPPSGTGGTGNAGGGRGPGASGPGGGGPGQAGRGPGGRGGMRGGRGGGRGGYGSIVAAGPVLLVLTPSQELVVIQANAEKYQELARFKVASTSTYAYPVVYGNRVFIKDGESLTLWTIE